MALTTKFLPVTLSDISNSYSLSGTFITSSGVISSVSGTSISTVVFGTAGDTLTAISSAVSSSFLVYTVPSGRTAKVIPNYYIQTSNKFSTELSLGLEIRYIFAKAGASFTSLAVVNISFSFASSSMYSNNPILSLYQSHQLSMLINGILVKSWLGSGTLSSAMSVSGFTYSNPGSFVISSGSASSYSGSMYSFAGSFFASTSTNASFNEGEVYYLGPGQTISFLWSNQTSIGFVRSGRVDGSFIFTTVNPVTPGGTYSFSISEKPILSTNITLQNILSFITIEESGS